MRGLNKRFKENPVAFLNRLLLLTRPGQPCPTCHCVMDLGVGSWGGNNIYARPDPMVIKFDLIGGTYAGGINAGSDLGAMLDPPLPQAPAPQPVGVAFDNPAAKYALLQVMRVGHARAGRPVGKLTREYTAYWLPWAHQGANEIQLTDQNVRFFFTAMFSGCTFCVATPAVNGSRNVWVTHIAWDPGNNAPINWGGVQLPAGPGNEDARRLIAERAFYMSRNGAGQPIRSVTCPSPHPLNMGGVINSVLISNGGVPIGNARYSYGQNGRAFIVGWRDNNQNWHFAVQKHPTGFNIINAPVAVPPANVAPVAVRQFY